MSAKYENASARSSQIMKALDRADDEKVCGFSATVIHEAVRRYGELSRREEDLSLNGCRTFIVSLATAPRSRPCVLAYTSMTGSMP